MKTVKRFFWLLCLICIPTWVYAEEGLQLKSFGEVVVDNLAIGETYNMTEIMNRPLEVAYEGNEPTHLLLKVDKPLAGELKPGFEIIPDASWISLGNSIVAIAANGTYKTDIKVTIPNDKKYLGKKYQAALAIRLFNPNASVMEVSMGVIGRFLFTIAPMEKPLRSSDKSEVNLNFTFNPAVVLLSKVEVGKKTKVLVDSRKPVKLVNYSDKKLACELVSIDPKQTVQSIYPDYEACPNPDYLTFPKSEITVAPKKEKPLEMWVEIPDQPEYRGKKYQFIVSAQTGTNTGGNLYMRVLVDTIK